MGGAMGCGGTMGGDVGTGCPCGMMSGTGMAGGGGPDGTTGGVTQGDDGMEGLD